MSKLYAPNPLFVVAMDHRSVMRRLFERSGEPETEMATRLSLGKTLTYRALERLLDAGVVDAGNAGVLVDELYGAHVARAAAERGCLLAMPVEASRPVVDSDAPEFDFEYGDEWESHLDAFPVDAVKVLIVHNPGMLEQRRARQADRCRLVMGWARDHGRPFMLEVLVPPTPDQLAAAGDRDTYERSVKPATVATAILDLQSRGVEPDIWKLEPLPSRSDYESVAGVCRADGRSSVTCLLLGGGADINQVANWVACASGVAGYSGFAVGRSIWQQPLTSFFDGLLDEKQTVGAIETNLRQLVAGFRDGSGAVPCPVGG